MANQGPQPKSLKMMRKEKAAVKSQQDAEKQV